MNEIKNIEDVEMKPKINANNKNRNHFKMKDNFNFLKSAIVVTLHLKVFQVICCKLTEINEVNLYHPSV